MMSCYERGGLFRIQFEESTNMGAVEEILLSAILAIECLHGEAAVRLEVGYFINADQCLVVLLAGTPMAIAVARVFVGMCSHELGEKSFRVLRGERAVVGRAGTAA